MRATLPSALTDKGHPRCQGQVWRRDKVLRYTGRGRSGFERESFPVQCAHRAKYADFCRRCARRNGLDPDQMDTNMREAAKQFINDQIKIMGEHGNAPKLSPERYKEAVASTEKTFAAMRQGR